MAFSSNGFVTISKGSGPTAGSPAKSVHFYATNDTKATIETDGYFDSMEEYCKTGDILMVSGDLDGTPFQCSYVMTVTSGDIALTAAANVTYDAHFPLTAKIADISTAGQVYIPCPRNCDIEAVYTTLGGAITGADATLTIKAPDGTVGTITVAYSGSAAGDVDSLTSGLSNTEVDAGEAIEIETDGGSTGTREVVVVVWCSPR